MKHSNISLVFWYFLTLFDTFWHVFLTFWHFLTLFDTFFDTFWHDFEFWMIFLTRRVFLKLFDTFWHFLTRFDTAFWRIIIWHYLRDYHLTGLFEGFLRDSFWNTLLALYMWPYVWFQGDELLFLTLFDTELNGHFTAATARLLATPPWLFLTLFDTFYQGRARWSLDFFDTFWHENSNISLVFHYFLTLFDTFWHGKTLFLMVFRFWHGGAVKHFLTRYFFWHFLTRNALSPQLQHFWPKFVSKIFWHVF